MSVDEDEDEDEDEGNFFTSKKDQRIFLKRKNLRLTRRNLERSQRMVLLMVRIKYSSMHQANLFLHWNITYYNNSKTPLKHRTNPNKSQMLS
jgi:hypothetical protein